MLPDVIDNTNFKYVQVNNIFLQSISFKSLPENVYFLDIVKDLPSNINYDFSIYVSKLDPIKAINNITFNIGMTQGELDTIGKNQQNIDVISKAKEDASLLRKKVQVENQEIYIISLIITFYSNNINKLNKNISSIKAKFYSKGISSEITNFRHLDFYLSNLPINIKNNKLFNNINITTDALSNIFPFYTTNFVDDRGAIIGNTIENKICILNIFKEKYENANMCIFGCSGSGKSFFTKLFIIRNYFLGRKQIILDIENEYITLVNKLEGVILFKDTYYNILQITRDDIKSNNFLESKINRVIVFISYFCDIDKKYLKEELFKIYEKFDINNEVKSVLVKEENDNLFAEEHLKDKEEFPTMLDLIDNMENNTQKKKLKEVVNSELKYFSKTTNIELDNDLYVISTKEIIKYPRLICFILQKILNDYLGIEETIIYIDEIWKYSINEEILGVIFNMYKTIRKKKASIISITQDMTDFFEYKNGSYANSILNNSCFKMFFKINFGNYNNFLNIVNLSSDIICKLKKGEAIFLINQDNVKLKIQSSDFESEIINENDYSNK